MIARRLMPLVLAVTLLGAAPVANAGAPKADLLDRAVKAWSRVKTVRATFEQTIINPLTGGALRASGEYQQRRPGQLSVKFNDPATDRIVADGKHVWLYLPSSTPNQVIRTSLQGGGTGTVDVSAQFLSSPRSRYTVTDAGALTIAGRPSHGYTLVPKSKGSAAFVKAIVYIDDADATIRQFTVSELTGIERTVRLTSFRTNVPVDAKAFVFTPPPGTRVITR